MNTKSILMAALMAASSSAFAQLNVQMHYDLGRKINAKAEPTRPNLTTTVEYFGVDKLGSNFFFIDLDYYSNGVAGAYLEASREFTLSQTSPLSSLAAHVEYNGGLSTAKDVSFGSRFQPSALAGVAWNWHSADFTTTFSAQLMYKQLFQQTLNGMRNDAYSGYQITAVWGHSFANGKMTFKGFADLWQEARGTIFITEPQLWWNVTNQFALGTEWEISNNFIYTANGDKFIVNPTLAVKYNF